MGKIVRMRCKPSPVYIRAEQRQHVADQAAGSLSVQDYCFAYGLSSRAFYSWRRRALAEPLDVARDEVESRRPLMPVFVEIDLDLHEPLADVCETSAVSKFAKQSESSVDSTLPDVCGQPESFVALAHSSVEVFLRCGRRLRVEPGFDEDALRSLVTLLESLPC